MTTPEERRAANDAKVAQDIQQHGCHVISVFDPEEKTPGFSYSVGLQETTGAAEAIIIGLTPKLGHAMINVYRDQLRAGTRFERGVQYRGFLEQFPVYVEPAEPQALLPYTLGCARYYRSRPYAVVQIIYPTTSGAWSWEAGASDWFRSNQPMLGRARPDQP